MSGFSGIGTINSVTEDRVTITANDTPESIRASAGFKEAEPETKPGESKPVSDDKTEKQAEKSDNQPGESDRNPDGTFKAKAPDAAKDDKGGDPRKSIQAKINEERRLRGEAERREAEALRKAADLEAKLAAGMKPSTPAVAGSTADAAPGASKPPTYLELVKRYQGEADWPTLEQAVEAGFADPYAAMNAAQAAYINEKRIGEWQAQQQQSQQDEQTRGILRDMHETGAAKYPDWQTLVDSPAASVELPAAVLNELFEDPPLSADLWHHLLSHPDELDALATVTDPIAAARAVTKLTVGLSTAHSGPETAPRQTKAKPLIKPVGASPAAPEASSPDELPFGPGYIKAMNERERKQRETRSGT